MISRFIIPALVICISVCLCLCRYEGTGRSLSLKLIQQLRQQSADSQQNMLAENRTANTARLAAGVYI